MMRDLYTPGGDWTVGPVWESVGSILQRLRRKLGISQVTLADRLCAVSESVTITRNEVSRWERGERVPSARWLTWLAQVLNVPEGMLRVAAERTRHRPWLDPSSSHSPPPTGIDGLRELENQVGGYDLVGAVLLAWREASAQSTISMAAVRAAVAGGAGPDLLSHLAQLADVACHVLADANLPSASARAGRAGLLAAHCQADQPLVSHLLGTLAESAAQAGETVAAGRLASASVARAAESHPLGLALALHRLANVQALLGSSSAAERTLAHAESAALAGRSCPEPPPSWLRWLDEPRLTLLTAQCYLTLHRPRVARSLLTRALSLDEFSLRDYSLCCSWLGMAEMRSDNPEQACKAAHRAMIAAVQSGSGRAASQIRLLDAQLRELTADPAISRYLALANQAKPYLPDSGPTRSAPLGNRLASCP